MNFFSEFEILTSTKRFGNFKHWEPIFIGTNREPLYDETFDWNSKEDRRVQNYLLCLLEYDFHVLSDGFLVYKNDDTKSSRIVANETQIEAAKEKILPEINLIYGKIHYCSL